MPSDIVKSELLLTLKEESFVSIKVYREERENECIYYSIRFCLGKPVFELRILDRDIMLLAYFFIAIVKHLRDKSNECYFEEYDGVIYVIDEDGEVILSDYFLGEIMAETYDIGLQNPYEFFYISRKNLVELTTFLLNKANEKANKIIEEEKAKSEVPNKGISYKDELYVNSFDGCCEICLSKLDKYTLPIVLIKTDGSSIIHDVEIGY